MRRAAVGTVGVVAAFALAWVHWVGLLVGGIVVGVLAPSWSRALATGVGFGLLAWLGFLVVLADAGRLAAYWGSGQLLYVSFAIPVVLGLVGSLAYGLKPIERAD
ncbi:hypothetical protein [Halobacterium wangiae]|uniref:hypothetical protein n=1 Tax=Halobacterium wangiae TaxID=2902623 RepID=UPI001E501DA1|nr:hypothetical protein [Halobacterium wangiae]